ncbi:MAG: RibD family protein [Dolichospermum sp. WA123]|nr:RibD family protein [Dolichospermum sp. WA123]
MISVTTLNRPQTTVVLAMSADGKITDFKRSPAKFGSPSDQAHLERQVAQSDAVMLGAGTLRADGIALYIISPELLEQRQQQGKSQQPIQIVCSRSGIINPQLDFFYQPVSRWLLTTKIGAQHWQGRSEFEQILVVETPIGEIDWIDAFQQLTTLGINHISIVGGGELVSSLLLFDLIDEIWLTICPLIFGGSTAPSPVTGKGFLSSEAPRLELLNVHKVDQEVFLHYRRQRC